MIDLLTILIPADFLILVQNNFTFVLENGKVPPLLNQTGMNNPNVKVHKTKTEEDETE